MFRTSQIAALTVRLKARLDKIDERGAFTQTNDVRRSAATEGWVRYTFESARWNYHMHQACCLISRK